MIDRLLARWIIRQIALLCCILFGDFQLEAQVVKTSGAARNVMMGTDLSSTVQLDTLLQTKHMYAIGPVHDLQGEITVFDGLPYVSKTEDGLVVTKIDSSMRAPFLVYTHVNEWIQYVMDLSISSLEDITLLIDSLARVQGIDTNKAFPFRLQANWTQVDYHIIMRDTMEVGHNHERHDQAKQKFTEKAVAADLIGFFSRHHEGVFTHRGQFVHVHYLREDRSVTGHLDGIRHRGTILVYLPKQ